ncbi:MAG: (Fe-S)-binding protein [Desulfobacterales bacterium]|nr:(Fe-S)-binding protein [Desulfobacterales bacterium]
MNQSSSSRRGFIKRAGRQSYIDSYGAEQCVECGTCLSGCLHREYSGEGAVEAIQALRQGGDCEAFLDGCVFCGMCNFRCPRDASPLSLMLERLRGKRKKQGDPGFVRYMVNGLEKKGVLHNYFTDTMSAFTRTEKGIVAGWEEPKQCDDLMFVGCGYRVEPRKFGESGALSGLPMFGGTYDCCGYISMRGGYLDEAGYLMHNLADRLSKSRFNRLVTNCAACQNQFSVSFERYTGEAFPYEVISVYQWLEEQVAAGKLKFQRELDMDCAFSDSCNGAHLGPDYPASVLRLCRSAGLNPVQLAHNGTNASCCGCGGLMHNGRIRDLWPAKKTKKKDLAAAGKSHVIHYCGGCTQISNQVHRGTHHYILDKLLWALGDDPLPEDPAGSRGIFNGSLARGMVKTMPSMIF